MPSVRARNHDRSALARSCTAIVSASLLATIGLGACSAPETPPPAKPASAAAARPDPRPTAAPLLTDVINRISERGSVRTTVRGDLGFIGDLHHFGLLNTLGVPSPGSPLVPELLYSFYQVSKHAENSTGDLAWRARRRPNLPTSLPRISPGKRGAIR